MFLKQVGRNTDQSGRINLSGSELTKLGVDIGDAIDVDVVESETVARAVLESKSSERFLIVTPA